MKILKYGLIIGIISFVLGMGASEIWVSIRNKEVINSDEKVIVSSKEKNNTVKEVIDPECNGVTIYEKGKYENYNYAYSVTVPTGFIGERSGCPMPNHGFVINLNSSTENYVCVDASYNAAFWENFDDAIYSHLDLLKNDKNVRNVKLLRKEFVKLGKLPSICFLISYEENSISMIKEFILAFRPENLDCDVVYTLQLITSKADYPKHRKVLTSLKSSWAMLPFL